MGRLQRHRLLGHAAWVPPFWWHSRLPWAVAPATHLRVSARPSNWSWQPDGPIWAVLALSVASRLGSRCRLETPVACTFGPATKTAISGERPSKLRSGRDGNGLGTPPEVRPQVLLPP